VLVLGPAACSLQPAGPVVPTPAGPNAPPRAQPCTRHHDTRQATRHHATPSIAYIGVCAMAVSCTAASELPPYPSGSRSVGRAARGVGASARSGVGNQVGMMGVGGAGVGRGVGVARTHCL
jgi:hypothetical protein